MNGFENAIEYAGLTKSIEDETSLLCRKEVQGNITVKEGNLCEISRVYLESVISEYDVIPGPGNGQPLCFIGGRLDFSIEYIENHPPRRLSIMKDSAFFSAYTYLPEDITEDLNLHFNTCMDYASFKLLSCSEIEYFVSHIISVIII